MSQKCCEPGATNIFSITIQLHFIVTIDRARIEFRILDYTQVFLDSIIFKRNSQNLFHFSWFGLH